MMNDDPLILLIAWAVLRYKPVPSISSLRRWAREGHIWPRPELVGRNYYVAPTARYARKAIAQEKQPVQLRLVA